MQTKDRIYQAIAFIVLVGFILLFASDNNQKNKDSIVRVNETYLSEYTKQNAVILDYEFGNMLKSIQSIADIYSTETTKIELDINELKEFNNNFVFDYLIYADSYGVGFDSDSVIHDVSNKEYFQDGINGNSGVAVDWGKQGENNLVFYAPVWYGSIIRGVILGYLDNNEMISLISMSYGAHEASSLLCDGAGRIIVATIDTGAVETVEDYFFGFNKGNKQDPEAIKSDYESSGSCRFYYQVESDMSSAQVIRLSMGDFSLIQTFPSHVRMDMYSEIRNNGTRFLSCICIIFFLYVAYQVIRYTKQSIKLRTQNKVVSAISTSYFLVHYITLKDGNYFIYKNGSVSDDIPDKGNFTQTIKVFAKEHVEKGDREGYMDFVDLSTLSKRMKGNAKLSYEFRNDLVGWCRCTFVPAELDDKGQIVSVLYLVELIGEERKREHEYQNCLEEANTFLMSQMQIIDCLSSIYDSVSYIDLEQDTFRIVKEKEYSVSFMGESGIASENFALNIDKYILADYKGFATEFFDIKTLSDRLSKEDYVSCELVHKQIGWCRALFITSERDPSGKAKNVLFAIQAINNEKKKEKEQQETLDNVKKHLKQEYSRSKQFEYDATHDALTGLFNRGGFLHFAEKYTDKDEQLGFLLLDVDKFKNVNDTYGHDMGDRILKKVADTLRELFAEDEIVIRFAGDEFVVMFPGYEFARADIIKNKINLMNQMLLAPVDELPAVSVSAGVAFATDGYSDALYKKADSALYFIKENGRKGCNVYDDGK